MNLEEVGNLIANNCDWNAFIGFCLDIQNDPGFKSKSDNMIVSSMREKAFSYFCSIPMNRVDLNGQDYELFQHGLEYKSQKTIFRKRKPNDKDGKLAFRGIIQKDDTMAIKMKNYYGSDKKDMDKFLDECKNTSTCKYFILNQTDPEDFRIALAEDEYVRSRYYPFGDGICADLEKEKMYFLDIPTTSPVTLNSYCFENDQNAIIKLDDLMSNSFDALLKAKFKLYSQISNQKRFG